MQLEHTDIIEAPREKVYGIVRDELPMLATYLPNIAKVQTLEYSQPSAGRTEIVNHWFAKAKVPALIEKMMSEDLFSWKDTAIWNNEKHQVEYSLESFLGRDIYDAKGINYFKEIGPNKTELKLTCEIVIHADKIPGIPRLLARKAIPMIEKMIEMMLEPNLTSLGTGLQKYFQDQGKKH